VTGTAGAGRLWGVGGFGGGGGLDTGVEIGVGIGVGELGLGCVGWLSMTLACLRVSLLKFAGRVLFGVAGTCDFPTDRGVFGGGRVFVFFFDFLPISAF